VKATLAIPEKHDYNTFILPLRMSNKKEVHMKHLRTFFSVSLIIVLAITALTGCKKQPQAVKSPFTEMTWENSVEDVIAEEGDDYTTYESIYNGTTYEFAKNYLDQDGTVKYMFDDNDKLMCVAWAFGTDDEETLKDTYNKIHQDVEDTYGESGYDSENPTNYGDVWYLENGNILLMVVTTDTQQALQYSYLNPEVSTKETEN